jgi:hypothetical protein
VLATEADKGTNKIIISLCDGIGGGVAALVQRPGDDQYLGSILL